MQSPSSTPLFMSFIPSLSVFPLHSSNPNKKISPPPHPKQRAYTTLRIPVAVCVEVRVRVGTKVQEHELESCSIKPGKVCKGSIKLKDLF